MASTDTAEPTAPTLSPEMSQLAAAIAAGIAANAPRRKVTFGEYNPKDALHPNGRKHIAKLTRTSFQNGTPLNPEVLSDVEINLVNQVKHSGRYCNRLVEVIVNNDGLDETIDIRHKNSNKDRRNDFARQCVSFEDELRQIIAEQAVEDADEDAAYERHVLKRATAKAKR